MNMLLRQPSILFSSSLVLRANTTWWHADWIGQCLTGGSSAADAGVSAYDEWIPWFSIQLPLVCKHLRNACSSSRWTVDIASMLSLMMAVHKPGSSGYDITINTKYQSSTDLRYTTSYSASETYLSPDNWSIWIDQKLPKRQHLPTMNYSTQNLLISRQPHHQG
jgi:hypothetical protein